MPAEGWMSVKLSNLAHSQTVTPVLAALRQKKPLVHNITNFVVMNWTANVLLAAGASPAMVHAVEEVAEFTAISQSLVINIGTLDAPFVAGMMLAASKARDAGIPWVLDPVGIGATAYRGKVSADLLAFKPSVIRANAGEIIALAGVAYAHGRGVDSLATSNEALEAGKQLSTRTGAVVAVTGAEDYVINGSSIVAIPGGHPISQDVTGTGCATTALVGACLAVAPPREAAIAGLALMKAAATSAAATSAGPGTFAAGMLDALYQLTQAATGHG
jgi:hydroxyethylthiazole kinase